MTAITKIMAALDGGQQMSARQLAAAIEMPVGSVQHAILNSRDSRDPQPIRICKWSETEDGNALFAIYEIGYEAHIPRPGKRRTKEQRQASKQAANLRARARQKGIVEIAPRSIAAKAYIDAILPTLLVLKGNPFATCIAQVTR